MKKTKGEAKILFLNKRIIFPNTSEHLYFENSQLIQKISVGENVIFAPVRGVFSLFSKKRKIGSLCLILGKQELSSQVKLRISCKEKVIITKVDKLKYASYSTIAERITPNTPIMEKLKKRSQELIFLINIKESDKLIEMLNFTIDLTKMMDFISDHFVTKFSNRYKIYNCINSENRAKLILNEITDIVNKINRSTGKI